MSTRGRSILKWASLMTMVTLLVFTWIHAAIPHSSEVHSVTAKDTIDLRISYTQITWHQKPVYSVTNQSGVDLHHFWITSWSEHDVPYLYIGRKSPANLQQKQPLSSPPYTLAAGQTLWFVGPNFPPAQFTAIWGMGTETSNLVLNAVGH